MATKFEGLNDDKVIIERTNTTTDNTADTGTTETSGNVSGDRTPTDPDKITVQVSNPQAPVILLFGAPSSGKTMTLVRLARYLRKNKGYSVSVDPLFVTSKDVWEYEENTKKFNEMLNTTTALPGTAYNDFLFIHIHDQKGNLICQILEGAGEDYFSSSMTGDNRVKKQFPPYMAGIFSRRNKKVWIFLTEPNWAVNQLDRDEYVERIKNCKNSDNFDPKRDKSIILYNKIDKTQYVLGKGVINERAAKNACRNEYNGIFEIFKTNNPLPFFVDKYTCKFVPFSTGKFGDAAKGQLGHYEMSDDVYPKKLWETIEQCIKG